MFSCKRNRDESNRIECTRFNAIYFHWNDAPLPELQCWTIFILFFFSVSLFFHTIFSRTLPHSLKKYFIRKIRILANVSWELLNTLYHSVQHSKDSYIPINISHPLFLLPFCVVVTFYSLSFVHVCLSAPHTYRKINIQQCE